MIPLFERGASIAFVWTSAHADAPPNTAGRAEARTHFWGYDETEVIYEER